VSPPLFANERVYQVKLTNSLTPKRRHRRLQDATVLGGCDTNQQSDLGGHLFCLARRAPRRRHVGHFSRKNTSQLSIVNFAL
jgi:hypothetical protein